MDDAGVDRSEEERQLKQGRTRGLSSSVLASGWRTAVGLILLLSLLAPGVMLVLRALPVASVELLGHLGRTVLPMQLAYSLAAALGATILAAALSLGGVLCGLFDFPGRRLLRLLSLLPLLVPAWFYAVVYQQRYDAVGLGPLVLVLAIGAAPLFQLLVTAALTRLPDHYVAVLEVSGRAAPWGIVTNLLPMTLPAVVGAAALTFLLSWGDDGAARVLAVPTLTVGMFDQWFGRQDEGAGASMAIALVVASVVPVLIMWAAVRHWHWSEPGRFQRERYRRVRLTGMSAGLPWVLGSPLVVAGLLIPGLVIGRWTWAALARADVSNLGGDTVRTLLFAVGATVLALVAASLLLRDRAIQAVPPMTTASRTAALALFAVPPLVLALAFIWLLPARSGDLVAWLDDTPLPLVTAQSMRYLAVLLLAGEAALLQTARGHLDLLRLSGRMSLPWFVRLFHPFLARPLLAAACFVFIESIKDLSLSLLLQPFGFTTLAMRIFRYLLTQRLDHCGLWVLCIALVGVYPLSLLARLADGEAHSRLTRR